MWMCILCRFEMVLDDTVAPTDSGRCVCLRCFNRAVEDHHIIRPDLLADLKRALAVVTDKQGSSI